MQPRFNCAFANAQVFGQRSITPILGIFQQQNFGIAFRQLRHCRAYLRATLLGQQPLQRISLTGIGIAGPKTLGVAID